MTNEFELNICRLALLQELNKWYTFSYSIYSQCHKHNAEADMSHLIQSLMYVLDTGHCGF
jgi:hypothetical protein